MIAGTQAAGKGNTLLAFDLDNTLWTSHGIYDETYRLTSKTLLDREFTMTQNPDGTDDLSFSRMTNLQLLSHRLHQMNIPKSRVDPKTFFARFDEFAAMIAESADFVLFAGVANFLRQLSQLHQLLIVSAGPKQLQITLLKRAGVIDFLDLQCSAFLGDFSSKKEAFETLEKKMPQFQVIGYFGDSPSDIQAIKTAELKSHKVAIGVTTANLVCPEELRCHGADLVIQEYGDAALRDVKNLVKD